MSELSLDEILHGIKKLIQYKLGIDYVPEEKVTQRLDICMKCSFREILPNKTFINKQENLLSYIGKCKSCGCYLIPKITVGDSCKEGKW